jgi:UDP-GlcNAc3NAcA epimerase
MTVIGARPQFMKCAAVSRHLREVASEILVHTGQHYDDCMSDIFFRDLNIPPPNYNLGIGSGKHGRQTGEMLKAVEELLEREEPDVVLVYGDTNSTLAGALAASKLHIPVAHVEAGLRSFNRRMPEEINRVVTDHISSLLFCPTKTAVDNLTREGVTQGVSLIGDVMYDALCRNLETAEKQSLVLQRYGILPKKYFLATVHRPENTDNVTNLRTIASALVELANSTAPVIFPVHPRTRNRLIDATQNINCSGVLLVEPVSYLDMLMLEKNAAAIMTDSGGVQKEAFWLSVPCITLREETEWIETVEAGWNFIVGADKSAIIDCAKGIDGKFTQGRCLNEDGHAAERIVSALAKKYGPTDFAASASAPVVTQSKFASELLRPTSKDC